ncbi:MAG: F0F1 ATP synthase subunit A [Nitrospiria bacterium]
MENPLHHFELHPILPLHLFGIDISINKAVIMMWIACGLVLLFFYLATRRASLVPRRLQSVAEKAVEFLRGMAVQNIGPLGHKFFPFIATLFFFVLANNVIGLIPGSYTPTSQIIVTGFFALLVYGVSLVLGFARHGLHFFTVLTPAGTPGWLFPLMIPIEVISQLSRPITLAVRLFANMTAGHIILTVLFSLMLVAPVYLGVFYIGIVPFAMSILIYGLELFVAFIQAYIFTILACVYLGESVKLH